MAHQGCPGEGSDHRALGWLICPLQRWLSWKSDKPPKLHYPHGLPGLKAWSYWPPYYVSNVIWVDGSRPYPKWRMFRIGWRYDNQWKGYIGPTAAYKKLDHPLLYY